MKRSNIIVTALLAVLAGLFVRWAAIAQFSYAAMLAAAVSAGLFGLCIIRLAPSMGQFLTTADAPRAELGCRESSFERRHPWAKIAVLVLALHALMYAAGYGFDLAKNGYSGGLLDNLRALWLRTDSPSYLGIAENWYVTEGDPRFHIVFFPLYPLCIKAFRLLTGDSFAAAMLVSNVCAVASSILMYELAALDLNKKDALFAALTLALFPGAIFLAAPMTESLFLALSLACMLATRKNKYILAGAFGALAAFTRSVGVLLMAPVFFEALSDYIVGKRLNKRAIIARVCGICMIAMGLSAYLGVNYAVTGDAFTFLRYQSEHWSQSFGAFWNTAAYQTQYALSASATGNAAMATTLYLPNLVCCFGALGLMAAAAPKLRPSYTAYFLVYFAASIGATWLLSGPRYLAVCFPVAFAVALLSQNKGGLRAVAIAVLALLMLIYLQMYVTGGFVY